VVGSREDVETEEGLGDRVGARSRRMRLARFRRREREAERGRGHGCANDHPAPVQTTILQDSPSATTLSRQAGEGRGEGTRPRVTNERATTVPFRESSAPTNVALGLTDVWQCPTDQKTWTNAPSALQAKIAITGLTSGTVYYFRLRAVTKAGEGAYSQVVQILVL
jgi:hypothetical protein